MIKKTAGEFITMNENMTSETEVQNVEMTAGEMLRNARTTGRRKREIQTIAKQLCIREEFLQALEDGDYSLIPEPVYILGFARNYAMELGLNPDEVVAKIKREMGMGSDGVVDADAPDAVVAAPSAQKGASRASAFVRRNWKWFVAAVVAVIAAIVLTVTLVAAFRSSADAEVPAVPVETVQVVVEPSYNKSVRERFGTENREKANVILQAIQDGWVKVEDARGNTVFSRVLVSGDVYYVPAGDGYKAIFGNAGGIDIWANGTLMEKAGPAHTRKAGISLNPADLKPAAAAPAAPAQNVE